MHIKLSGVEGIDPRQWTHPHDILLHQQSLQWSEQSIVRLGPRPAAGRHSLFVFAQKAITLRIKKHEKFGLLLTDNNVKTLNRIKKYL